MELSEILSYLLPRPPLDGSPERLRAYEDLWESNRPGDVIDYRLPYPKWQFLSYLCETKELVLHGSQKRDIAIVQPRQAIDKREFSNQRAIYASTDGIWVIYFAILDREKYTELTLFNAALRIRMSVDQLSDPLYFFSITHSVLLHKPWCEGMIYILPRATFTEEAPHQVQGLEIVFPHWISQAPAEPIARLPVGIQDFPFPGQIHGHDNDRLFRMIDENPDGFPWPEALLS